MTDTADRPVEGGSLEALPLSRAQRRLWFVQRLDPASPAYNIPLAFLLRGPLDPVRLRAALQGVVERHEALRTSFAVHGGEPVQLFNPRVDVPWEELDLSAVGPERRLDEVDRVQDREALEPFDLERGPLLRSRLLRLAGEEHLWLLTVHHLVFDGWSQEVFLDEVGALYRAAAGDGPEPAELALQYADVAAWMDEQSTAARRRELVDLWRRDLQGYPTVLQLPTDRPRPPRQTFRGEVLKARLPAALETAVDRLAADGGATRFMIFLAAWFAVLHRLSGEDRLLVASPVAGRGSPEAERLIGCFVNTLIVPGDLQGDPDAGTLLDRVRTATLASVEREELMFEELVEALNPERDPSYPPLAQVGFSADSYARDRVELAPGLVATLEATVLRSSKSDATLMVKSRGEGTECLLEYNSDLFDRTTARRWLGYVERSVEAIVRTPRLRLSELPLPAPPERHALRFEWAAPRPAGPMPQGLAGEFLLQAARRPDAVAVEQHGTVLTYGGLERWSRELASRLAARGVGRGTPVVLALDRSVEMVVAMLSVVRAGGFYAPLDPEYPEERRRLVLDDLGAPVAVADLAQGERADATATAWLAVARPGAHRPAEPGPGAVAHPEDLACVLYTSGSTGRPKGVALPHRGILRLGLDADYTSWGPEESLLHQSSVSFDAATLEVWPPLLTGGRVALAPAGTPSPRELAAAADRLRVTRMFLTTAVFDQIAERPEQVPQSVDHLMTGGEAASPEAFRRMLGARPDLGLSNLYGPTENTTLSTHHRSDPARDGEGPIPIGRAIGGSACRVVDGTLRDVPQGVVGELLVGGAGLARGYWRRPGLTAERFVPHPEPERPGERLYRTGDLARWRAVGVLDFRGRNDSQVKVRGLRIEPGEVEAVLAAHPDVGEAAVVVRDLPGESGRALVGYYALRPGAEASPGEVRGYLESRLPPFMVPAALVPLDELPLTVHGKIDRRALPAPDLAGRAEERVPPRTPLEEHIAAVWEELLGVDGVGIADDFFALGGHSLLATRVLARLADEFDLELSLQDFFDAPTVAGLAETLGARLLEDEPADLDVQLELET